MNEVISRQGLGVLALLCASASMAATVSLVPSNPDSSVGESFFLTVHGDGFPVTAGATLALSWDPTVVTMTGLVLAPGSPFDVLVGTPPSTTYPYLVSVLAPLAADPFPSGSFDAFQINLVRLAPGYATVKLLEGYDLGWVNRDGSYVPVTYTQFDVSPVPGYPDPVIPGPPGSPNPNPNPNPTPPPVYPPVIPPVLPPDTTPGNGALVPLPATIWLFGSAIAAAGWLRRKAMPWTSRIDHITG